MILRLVCLCTTGVLLTFQTLHSQNSTPANFKVAFIGDQGLSADSRAVLNLIKDEGTQVVVHAGDFDYRNDPGDWEDQINDILGVNFPYFACAGEDDMSKYFTSNGYQDRMENRMNQLGISWDGSLGIESSFTYNGIFFLLTSPGIQGSDDDDTYIRNQLASTNAIWRISTFHKNQKKMQLCGHANATGWGVYEESRKGGAFTTSGQCHVYARTHLLSDMSDQTIASTSDTLILTADLPQTPEDEGKTFAVVSGLAGRSRHSQNTNGAWWASKYSSDQDSQYGALFGTFNHNGIPNLAMFYFKTIDGDTVDTFYVRSLVNGDYGLTVNIQGSGTVDRNPSASVFEDGTVVTLTANPANEWTFSGWSGDFTGTQNLAVITMDTDKTVTATFTPPSYTLTVGTVGSGSVDVNPAAGTYVLGTVITMTPVPDPGWTFGGWSGDASGNSSPLDLTIDSDKNITAVFFENEAPAAVNDVFNLDEDNLLSISGPGVLANDTDPDGDPLQVSLVAGPSNGTITLNGSGAFDYTPTLNFNGTDSFTYLASDGKGGFATGTASLTINAVNDLPVVAGEAFSVVVGKTLTVAAPGLLANDDDIDGDNLIPSLQSSATGGTVSINSDGSFSYISNNSFLGDDGFTYQVADGNGGTATATVTVSVNRGEIKLEQVATGGSSGSNVVSTATALLGVDEELYLAAISMKSNEIVGSVSGMGLNWTRAQAQCSGRDQTGVEVWMAQGIPTTSDIIIATFFSAPTNAVIAVSRYSGIDESNPIATLVAGNTNGPGQDCSGGDDSDIYSFDFTTTGASSVVYAALALRNKTHNPSGGFTERVEVSRGTGGSAAGLAVVDRTFDLVSTDSISGSFDQELDWALAGLELRSKTTQYVLAIDKTGLGSVSLNPAGGVYNEGTTVTLTASPAPEWSFASWGGHASGTATSTIITMDGDKNVNATFDPPIYTLTLDQNGSGNVNVDPPGNLHVLNTLVTLTATPDSGFTFGGWSGDLNSAVGQDSIAMDSDKTVTATFFLNEVPTPTNDSYTVNEDDSLVVPAPGVLSNDSDPDGNPLVPALYEGPTNGVVNLSGNGSFTYTPFGNFNGSDSFIYEVRDGKGGVATATVVFSVAQVNDAPSAGNDSLVVNEDDSLTVLAPGVLSNDSDLDGDGLSASAVSGPSSGTLTLNADGSLNYVPQADFNGIDVFTYSANDGNGGTATASVIIRVDPTNDAPAPASDAYTLDEDDTLKVSLPGVLTNDSDIDGDALSTALSAGPSSGTVSLNADGSFIYIPNPNFNGIDSFVYTADDSNAGTATATVSLTVTPVNDPPAVVADSYSVAEDDTLTVPAPGVLSNDSDVDDTSLLASLANGPSNGILTLDQNGSIVYVPSLNFNGLDFFTYSAIDTSGAASTDTVTITTHQVNDLPVAVVDSFAVAEDDTLAVPAPGILSNDGDVDGDGLTASLVASPSHGSLTLNSDGSLMYVPILNFNGDDEFTYSISDGNGGTASASVKLAVNSINDRPQAQGDFYQISEDDTLAVVAPGLLSNDSDADGDSLVATVVSAAVSGIVILNSNGSFNYVPASGFSGSDVFSYSANDGNGAMDTATVTVTIDPVNDPPLVVDENYTVIEDDTLFVPAPGLLSNDSDPDGDPMVATVVTSPTNGTLGLNTDGSFSYAPNPDFFNQDTFTYAVTDPGGETGTGSVVVTVEPRQDPPFAMNDVYFVDEFNLLSVSPPGVLGNDGDPDGDVLVASLVSGSSNGALTFNSDGSFTYAPNAGFLGTDSFTYSVSDPNGSSELATVNVTVNPQAVTHYSTVSGGSSDSDVVSTSGNVAALNGALYLAAISTKSYELVTAVSGLGLTWTPVRAQCSGRNNTGVEIWKAQGLPTGDGPVSANLGAAPRNATIVVSVYSGVDRDNPVRTVISGNTNGTEGTCSGGDDSDLYSFDVPTTPDGSLVYGAISMRNKTHDAGAGWFERIEAHQGDGGSGASIAIVDSSTGAVSSLILNGLFDNDVDWALVGIEIKSGSTGGIPPQYALGLNTTGSGTVNLSPTGGIYAAGTVVTLAAAPDSGWTFNGWGGDVSGLDPTVDLTMDGDKNVAATFEELPPPQFSLSLSTSGPGNVEFNPPGGTYVIGTTVTLTANPDTGFAFIGWTGDLSSTDNPFSVVMNSDRSLLATFISNEPPVAINDVYQVSEDDTLAVTAPGVLDNDTDSDGDSLATVVSSGPSHGTLSLNRDGSFSYTPAADFHGSDAFVYSVDDGKGTSSLATALITVNPVNDPPFALSDSFSVAEDDSLAIPGLGVLANDSDADGDTLTASIASGTSSGSLALNGDGSFDYIPDGNFNGVDAFSYMVSDGNGGAATGSVTLVVVSVNDFPQAAGESFVLNEDDTLTVGTPGVLGNDSDSDGDALSASIVSGPANGTVSLNSDGSFIFTPAPNFNGPESFTYTASDSGGGSASATVNLTINPIEDPPLAVDDGYFVDELSVLTVAAPGVLGNDSDADGDPLTAVVANEPTNGVLNFNGDGSFTYTPNPGFLGSDTFTYDLSDGNGGSASATVVITVNPLRVTHQATITGASSNISQVATSGEVSAVNRDLYLAAISTKPFRQVTAVFGLGLTWTPVRAQCAGRNNTGVQLWMAQGFPTSDSPVTATLSASPKNAVIAVSRYSGVDFDDPLGNLISGNTNGLDGGCSGGNDSEAYSFGFTTTVDGSVVYGAVGMRNKTHSPGAGYIEQAEVLQGLDGSGASVAIVDQELVLAATTTLSGTFDRDVDWALVAIEIKPGSSGGTSPQYSLTVTTLGSGEVSVDPAGGVYDPGTTVALMATPDSGWAFAGWSGDLSGTATSGSVTMTTDKAVTATFEELPPEQFTLTVTTQGAGTVSSSPPGPEFDSGTTVALTAIPDSGWTFLGWSGDLGGSTNPSALAMNSDKSVLATFVQNGPPVAVGDAYSVAEDETLTIAAPGVLTNDSDPDGDGLASSISNGVTNGVLALNGDGSFSYTPSANFFGSDAFAYLISDGRGGEDTASVALTITSVNDAPVAGSDSYQATEDDTLIVSAPGILANDSDVDGDNLTPSLLSAPSNGILNLRNDGSFDYLPALNFDGTDSFSYLVSDGSGQSDTANVNVTVSRANDLPVAQNDAFILDEDETLSVSAPGLLANDNDADGDPLSASVLTGPTSGTLTLNPDGSLTYAPDPNFNGQDAFTYDVADGNGGTASGSVTLTINPVEDDPIAVDDLYSVELNTTLDVPAPGPLSNDYDGDGDDLAATLASSTSNGSLSFSGDGSFSYIPNFDFTGTDTFSYLVSDSSGGFATAAVTLVVNPAQVTFEESVQGGSSESTTLTTSAEVTAINNHLYLAAISTKPFRAVDSVSGLGLTWTRVQDQCAGRNNTGVEVWKARGAATGNGTVTANLSRAPKNAVIVVSRYSGVHAIDPIGNLVSGNTNGIGGGCSGGADSGFYAFDFSTSAGGSLVYGAVGMRNKTHTPGAGFTEIIEAAQGSGGSGANVAIHQSPVPSVATISLAGSFNDDVDWAVVGLEIKSGSGTAGPAQYNLSVNTVGSGSVGLNPVGGVYNEGAEVVLTATAELGWAFDSWSGDLSGSDPSANITMDANKTVTATFVELPPVQLTLTTTVAGDGTVELSPGGGQYAAGTVVTLTAVPDSGNSFTAWIGDLNGTQNPRTLAMDSNKNVQATFELNSPPVALDDAYSLTEDDTLNVAAPGLLTNDSDPDGDSLVATASNPPSSGTLMVNADGSFSYTPSPNFNGADTFTYDANDGKGGVAAASVILTVNPVNDDPVVVMDAYSVTVDEVLNVAAPGVLENDSDADGDPLVVSLLSDPANGALVLDADGSFVYTPAPGFIGSDTFAYLVSDGNGATASAAVTVAVNPDMVVHEETLTGGAFESTQVATPALTGASGHLYLAAVSTKPNRSVIQVDGLGLTWTLIRAQCAGRNNTGMEIWRAQGAPSGDGVVTATLSSGAKNAVIAVSRYSGVDPGNSIGNVVAGNSNGADGACSGGSDSNVYAFDLSTTVDGAIVYSATGTRGKAHDPGIGFTERAEAISGSGGSAAGLAVQDQFATSASSLTIGGGFSRSVDWAVIGLEIKPPGSLPKRASGRGATDTQIQASPPSRFGLFQNYPNPFNPSTVIHYDLPAKSRVTLTVYDINGRTVATLVNDVQKAGSYRRTWDATDSQGRPVASGVYFYRLRAGEYEKSLRMLMVR